jgi:hypothetical protein
VPPPGGKDGGDGSSGGSRRPEDKPSAGNIEMMADCAAGQKHPAAKMRSGVLGTAASVCFQIIHVPSPGTRTSRINCRRIEIHFTSPRLPCQRTADVIVQVAASMACTFPVPIHSTVHGPALPVLSNSAL